MPKIENKVTYTVAEIIELIKKDQNNPNLKVLVYDVHQTGYDGGVFKLNAITFTF